MPIIREDIQTQRKLKQQPPLSDAYLSGMPAKRRKVGEGGRWAGKSPAGRAAIMEGDQKSW